MTSRGVVYVHSTPLAVAPHVEWAIARVLGAPVRMEWSRQPVDPGTRRAECQWAGAPGTAARFAAALRGWPMVRFEVTEEPSPGHDGERFMHVPGRGLFRATTSANGDIVIAEDQVRQLITSSSSNSGEALAHALGHLLGAAWDRELEPYRQAGEGAPTTWLTQVS